MFRNFKYVTLLVMPVVLLVVTVPKCSSAQVKDGRTKFKRKLENDIDLARDKARGFFSAGGLLSLGKVLNFFPVGEEEECEPTSRGVAKSGICLNPYDCRQRDGNAAGDCAHGLGVCCVFEVTCGGMVQNNVTYFSSPGFPDLWSGDSCNITIEPMHAGINQLRIDFLHFTIGQPNRTTGECDRDAMILGEGETNLTLCGQNHGQHVYYTLFQEEEARFDGEFPSTAVPLSMRFRGDFPRLWLARIAQLPLAQTAPHDCLQYYTGDNGTIKTFNYAVNGRHLAPQRYRACVRRNEGFCSIRYEPCDPDSFRIGQDPKDNQQTDSSQDEMMVTDETQNEDMMEGSGENPDMGPSMQSVQAPPQPSMLARIWRFIWPFGSRNQEGRTVGWSPYHQLFATDERIRYTGYGNRVILKKLARRKCRDKISIACDNEYFVMSSMLGAGFCDPDHCGGDFCPGARNTCYLETSVTPFAVTIDFGPPKPKSSPEDNIGACLRYTQISCDER